MSRTRALLIIAAAAVPAIVGAVLLIARATEPEAASGRPAVAAAATLPLPPVVYARQLCTLANDDAQIRPDPGLRRRQSDRRRRQDVVDVRRHAVCCGVRQADRAEQIAWSDGLRPDGCPRLHYYAPNGVSRAVPAEGRLAHRLALGRMGRRRPLLRLLHGVRLRLRAVRLHHRRGRAGSARHRRRCR